jgi:hypothetical protein
MLHICWSLAAAAALVRRPVLSTAAVVERAAFLHQPHLSLLGQHIQSLLARVALVAHSIQILALTETPPLSTV